jgi:regulator of sigma E protease
MSVLQNLHWVVILLGALIFFHELGHFVVAKAVGVKVLRFSLGFGPRLLGVTVGETEYVRSALPLGGYVKMLGEAPGVEIPAADLARAFSSRPLWARAAVVVAGPVFNFVLAVLVYLVMFTGTHTYFTTRMGIVMEELPAWRAGLRPGDLITSVNGEPVYDFEDLHEHISKNPGGLLRVTYERDGQTLATDILPEARDEANLFQETERRGRIGVSPQFIKPIVGVVDADSPAARAGVHTGDVVQKVGGQPVSTYWQLHELVARTPAGTPVALGIERDGKTVELSVLPGAAPAGLPTLGSAADTPAGYTGLVSIDVLVARVDADTPAARLGLAAGDRLLRLRIEKPDGKTNERSINTWNADLEAFSGLDARSKFVLTYQRGREVVERPLTLDVKVERDEHKNERTRYVFGAFNKEALGAYTAERFVGPFAALREAVRQVGDDATLIGGALSRMVRGKISLDTMGGPIMLFVVAKESARQGLTTFLTVLAKVSVNLGMLNLVPVPVLDGGHLLFFTLEAIRRRPLSLRVRELANVVGFALLVALMVLAFKNDLLRYVLG